MDIKKKSVIFIVVSVFLCLFAWLVYAADIPTITIESNSVQNSSFYNAAQNGSLEVNITTDELANATFSLDAGVTNYTLFTINTNATTTQLLNYSAEGLNTLYVYVMNYTNATHSNFTTVVYTVDTIDPVASLDSPANDTETNNPVVTFEFTPTDANLEACVLYHDADTSGTLAVNESNLTVTSGQTNSITTTLPAGSDILWNIWCNDTVGNLAFNTTWNYTLFIDTTAPVVSLVLPVDDSDSSTSAVTFTFSATETDLTLDTCVLYHNSSGSYVANETNSTVSSGTNSLTANFPDGEGFIWNIWCNDTVGNSAFNTTGTATNNYTLNVDATGPEVSLDLPTDASYNNSNQIGFYFTPTDTNIETCVLYHNASNTFTSNSSISGLTSGIQASITVGFGDQNNIMWNIWCNDTFGNSAFNTTSNYTVTVDSQPPTVIVTTVGGTNFLNNYNSSSPSVTFGFTYSDANIEGCYLWHNGSGSYVINNSNLTSTGLTSAGSSITATFADKEDIWWNIWCNDSAGNSAFNSTATSSNNYTLAVDTTSPVLSVEKQFDTVDKDNFYRGGDDITLLINVSDLTATTVTINWSTIDNNVSAIETCTSDCTVTYPVNDTSSIGTGGSIIITASDIVSNSNNATSTYVIFNMGIPEGFNSSSTNFSADGINMAAIDLVLQKEGVGIINFTSSLDLSNETLGNMMQQFGDNVDINMSGIDSLIYFNASWFNKTASVVSSTIALTFGNLASSISGTPTINKDGSSCSLCSAATWVGNDLYFTAVGFSNYTLQADTTEPFPNLKGTEGSQDPSGYAYIYANWSDGSLGSGLNVTWYNGTWNAIGSAIANTTNPMTNFSYHIPATDESQTLTFRINATDAGGNVNGTGDLTVSVNGVLPTITVISAEDGNGTHTRINTTTFTITATDTSNINCSLTTFDIVGLAVYTDGDMTDTCTDSTSITRTVPLNSTADNTYTLMVNFTDKWGNRGYNATSFTIDATPPVVSMGIANLTQYNVSMLVSLTAVATDAITSPVNYSWDFDEDGTYEIMSTGTKGNHTYTSTGVKKIALRVYDQVGNSFINYTWVNITSAIVNNINPTGQNVIFPDDVLVSGISGLNSTVNFTDYGNDSSNSPTVGSTVFATPISFFSIDVFNTTYASPVQVNFSIYSSSLNGQEQGDVQLKKYNTGTSAWDLMPTWIADNSSDPIKFAANVSSFSDFAVGIRYVAAAAAADDDDDDSGTSSSSSGGGGISSTANGTITQYWKALSPGSLGVMRVRNIDVPLSVVKFQTINRLVGITLKLSAVDELKEVPAVSGSVLKYFEFTKKKFTDDDINYVKLKFSVDKSWIEEKGVSEVSMMRYTSSGWEKLETELVDSDVKTRTYEATSPGFSYFAIAGNGHATEAIAELEPEVEVEMEEAPETTPTGDAILPDIPTAPKKPWTGWVVAIVILVIGVGIYLFMQRPKKKGKLPKHRHH